MGITRAGLCVECNDGVTKLLAKPSKGLCVFHNNQRLQKDRPPRKRIPYKRKKTGEAELFAAIWAVRPHVCTNCQAPLGNEMKTFFFSHIKSKGAHPELRLKPSNIQLLCQECHHAYDFQGQEKFKERTKIIQL